MKLLILLTVAYTALAAPWSFWNTCPIWSASEGAEIIRLFNLQSYCTPVLQKLVHTTTVTSTQPGPTSTLLSTVYTSTTSTLVSQTTATYYTYITQTDQVIDPASTITQTAPAVTSTSTQTQSSSTTQTITLSSAYPTVVTSVVTTTSYTSTFSPSISSFSCTGTAKRALPTDDVAIKKRGGGLPDTWGACADSIIRDACEIALGQKPGVSVITKTSTVTGPAQTATQYTTVVSSFVQTSTQLSSVTLPSTIQSTVHTVPTETAFFTPTSTSVVTSTSVMTYSTTITTSYTPTTTSTSVVYAVKTQLAGARFEQPRTCFTVSGPAVCNIQLSSASGGSGGGVAGGRGGGFTGTFQLSTGVTYEVILGIQGGGAAAGSQGGGGGGGGSFVYEQSSGNLLMVVGGGGGGSSFGVGGDAQSYSVGPGYPSGQSPDGCAGGGGAWQSNGQGNEGGQGRPGGFAQSGVSCTGSTCAGVGGFGGGGGGCTTGSGGGGGGYGGGTASTGQPSYYGKSTGGTSFFGGTALGVSYFSNFDYPSGFMSLGCGIPPSCYGAGVGCNPNQ